jgi:hypothetical protein
MTDPGSPYVTTQIEPDDARSGFSCGKHPLDDYFKRHAVANDRSGISRAYVLRRGGSVERTLRITGLVPPSRAFIAKRTTEMGVEIADAAARLEHASRSEEEIPAGIAAVS